MRAFVFAALLFTASSAYAQTAGIQQQPLSPAAMTQFDARLADLERQVRDLTNQVERAQFNNAQMQNRLERLSSDIDVRFEQAKSQPAPGMGAMGVTAPVPPSPTAPAQPGVSAEPAPVTESQEGTAPAGDPQAIYDKGFAELRQANYVAAETMFKQFLEHYPKHDLAGNAQYWLGETHYVRGQFKEAAVAFAEGYQTYPKASKSADNLLKLAMSLGSLNNKADACLTLKELKNKYPTAAPTIRTRAEQERRKLNCTN